MATATQARPLYLSWVKALARSGATMHDLYALEGAPLPDVEKILADQDLCVQLEQIADEKAEYEKSTVRTIADVIADLRKRDNERLARWREQCLHETQLHILNSRNDITKLFSSGAWAGHLPAMNTMPARPVTVFEHLTDDDLAQFLRTEAPGDKQQVPDVERTAALKKFDERRLEIIGKRPRVEKLERIAACSLVFFNSAVIGDCYADQFGGKTTDKSIVEWVQAAGVERANESVKEYWFKPITGAKRFSMLQKFLDVIQ